MASAGDDKRGFPKAVWGWVAAWAVLAILAVIWGVPNEENDLADRATEILAGTGLSVAFDGRDAIIVGSADQPTIDAVGDDVYGLRGVRRVDTSQTEAATAPTTSTTVPTTTSTESPDLAAPRLRASFADGAIVLGGAMPDQATIDALSTAAVSTYGTGNLTYEMSVGDVGDRDYLNDLPELLRLAGDLDSWDLALEDDRVTFHGMGPDQETVTSTATALNELAATTALPSVDIAVEVSPSAVAASLTDLLAGGANFGTGSATLSPEATAKLDQIVEIMIANPSSSLIVEGHTDGQGDAAANQALSEARAQAVVDYLVAGGVDPDRLSAAGYGEERPIADNGTAEGRSQNRRIEFVVREGE